MGTVIVLVRAAFIAEPPTIDGHRSLYIGIICFDRNPAHEQFGHSALIQYNSQSELVSSNIRFAWLDRSGTGLFLVFNERRDAFLDGGPAIGRYRPRPPRQRLRVKLAS